jgi:LysR family transcriptional activator of nhaA
MRRLNYHHLLYFWTVAKEGGLAPAGKALHLSLPTLSSQIHQLEEHLGEKLFAREGRRLVPTEMGRLVYRYADEIFSLGRELEDAIGDRPTGGLPRLQVGVTDAVPKVLVHRLLEPVLYPPGAVRLTCHEDSYERLLARLSLHELDLVISDAPVPPGSARAHAHLLGECGLTFLAYAPLARSLRRKFPASLSGVPLLLPLDTTPVRRQMDRWFAALGVSVHVAGEFQDSALLASFGAEGLGVFAVPAAVEADASRRYGVEVVGRTNAVREPFYAITGERRLENPAIRAVLTAARDAIFRQRPSRRRRARESARGSVAPNPRRRD